MNKSTLVIAALALANLAQVSVLAYQYIRQPVIYADHVQQLRMDVVNEVLRVRLGSSDLPNGPTVPNPKEAGVIALTPRAAIQLQVQLGKIIKLTQEAAEAQREEQQSRRQSL